MTHLCSVRVSPCTLIHYISPTSIFILFSPLSMFLSSLILSFYHYFLRFVSYFSPRYTSYTLDLTSSAPCVPYFILLPIIRSGSMCIQVYPPPRIYP